MSIFGSGEEFFIKRDQFCNYIEDVVNPARSEAGLETISRAHAAACFSVIDRFFTEWTKHGATDRVEASRSETTNE